MSSTSTRTALDRLVADHEAKRRQEAYGTRAKLLLLSIVSSVAAAVYAVCTVRLWLFTAPLRTVVIDGVMVDVVADDTTAHLLARASGFLLVLALTAIAAIKLEIHQLVFGVEVPSTSGDASQAAVLKGNAAPVLSALSIAQRPHNLVDDSTSLWWNTSSLVSTNIAISGADTAVRTLEDLDALIQQGNAAQNKFHSDADMLSNGLSNFAPPAFNSANGIFSMGVAGTQVASGIAVRYQSLSNNLMPHDRNQRQAATAESEFSTLGVLQPERSLMKLRQWAAALCKAVTEDIDKCDAWLSEKRVRGFDCSSLLSEQYELPTASVAARPPVTGGFGGFGGGAMAQPLQASQPAKISKSEALLNEKRKLQMQNASSMETYDCMHRIDLRLSLEQVLDVGSTFPNIGGSSNSQSAARMRQGIIQRLRALGQSRNLSNMTSSSDKPWVPADPYILTHIMRVRVPCLANYLQLPYAIPSGSGSARDLRIYVGGTGDPYFYVRHRTGMQEKHMNTTEGPDSLFEALLLFFAVIQRVYHGAYGNVEGVVDLKQLNLDTIL
jgi:hypothetical protein